MTRHIRLIQAAAVLAFIFVFGVRPSFADMMAIGTGEIIADVGVAFCVTVAVEFVIIYLLLGRPPSSKKWLFLRLLFINAISFPLAHIGFFFWTSIDHSTPWPVILGVIELLVVLLEWVLLIRIFETMHRMGKLHAPVSSERTLTIAFAANLASCLLGLVLVLVVGFIVFMIAHVLAPPQLYYQTF
jgi:hypothetical protein